MSGSEDSMDKSLRKGKDLGGESATDWKEVASLTGGTAEAEAKLTEVLEELAEEVGFS
jgi:hypothetical protein